MLCWRFWYLVLSVNHCISSHRPLKNPAFPQVTRLVRGDEDVIIYTFATEMDQNLFENCVIYIQVHTGEDVKFYQRV